MPFNVNLSVIHLTNGAAINVPPDGALIIVGPNNSGKTVLLREIVEQIYSDPHQQSLAVRDIVLRREGSVNEVIDWLRENVSEERSDPESGPQKFYKSVGGGRVTRTEIEEIWPSQKRLNSLGGIAVATQNAGSRLNLVNDASLHDLYKDLPSHILQALFMRPDMEHKLTKWVREAFGFDVCVNRYGLTLRLLVGRHPDPLPPPPPSAEVLELYDSLRRVSNEGDGVRAFVGLLLHVMLSPTKIAVIDEPEAFLHPPQARRLGRLLLEEAPTDRQLIVATHSQDFLQGVLDAQSRGIKVLRTSRSGGQFDVRAVQPNRIKVMLSNPLLRYSNLLNGLFHTAVILCEGDSDCRFYQAVTDNLRPASEAPLDILYTHTNGKSRIARGLQLLNGFHIKSAAILDFDVLEERRTLKDIVEAANGEWDDFREDYDTIVSAVASMGTTVKSVGAVRNLLGNAFARYPDDDSMPDRLRSEIKTLINPKSQWDALKKSGLNLLEGSGHAATRRTLDRLKGIGVFVVPVGVLERWIPLDVGKQNWLPHVLENHHHLNAPQSLSDFIDGLVAYLKT